ncbi:MAG TPA: hypothetical protein VE176_01630 [Candidatus Limnocylindrales bacterium]|nr:hypothetical protein [Candidatus Limnocylindrales bacterium]
MTRRGLFALAPAAAILWLGPGCSASTLISTLQTVVDAVGVALPVVLTLAGVPAPIAALLQQYLRSVNQAVQTALPILAKGMLTAADIDAIIAAFSAAVLPNLSGVPAQVGALLTAVAQAVAHLIESLRPRQGILPTAAKPVRLTMRAADRSALARMQREAAVQAVALGAGRP